MTGPLLCERNGKPCGTDTFREGLSCGCANCQKWMAEHSLMIAAGRAMAPQVNKILAGFQKQIDENK